MIDFKNYLKGGSHATNLSFEQGIFKFRRPTFLCRDELDRDAGAWTCTSPELYETRNLRAAAGFRRYADESAEKIFKRAFQELYDPVSLPLLPFLDPHQFFGVNWILTRKRSYLAHAPGAGKTAQAIVAALIARRAGDPPAVVICPPDLTVNWEREIRKFWDMYCDEIGAEPLEWPSIGVIGRTADQERVAWRGHFLIVPDSMLTKEWVYAQLLRLSPRMIIVDEASRLKESTTDRSLAFYGGRYKSTEFLGLFQDCRHVVFMDGSPMPNRPMELWAPTYALHPEAIDCMSQRDFGFKYCGATMNERGEYEFKHASNEKELRERLQKDFMHVVTEDQLSHPERRRSLLYMNQDVRSAAHKEWDRRHLSKLNFGDIDEEASQGEIASYRAELGMRKVPWVAQYVRRRLEEKNEQILLFAWHREVCSQLLLELVEHDAEMVIGGVHAAERERIFEKFQSGKCRVIIGNIAAMGRGHNLQKADRVIFAEFAWSDETNKQAEKRASRRGSDKEFVRCEYIVCPNSMDEPVLSSLFTKQARVKRIIG